LLSISSCYANRFRYKALNLDKAIDVVSYGRFQLKIFDRHNKRELVIPCSASILANGKEVSVGTLNGNNLNAYTPYEVNVFMHNSGILNVKELICNHKFSSRGVDRYSIGLGLKFVIDVTGYSVYLGDYMVDYTNIKNVKYSENVIEAILGGRTTIADISIDIDRNLEKTTKDFRSVIKLNIGNDSISNSKFVPDIKTRIKKMESSMDYPSTHSCRLKNKILELPVIDMSISKKMKFLDVKGSKH